MSRHWWCWTLPARCRLIQQIVVIGTTPAPVQEQKEHQSNQKGCPHDCSNRDARNLPARKATPRRRCIRRRRECRAIREQGRKGGQGWQIHTLAATRGIRIDAARISRIKRAGGAECAKPHQILPEATLLRFVVLCSNTFPGQGVRRQGAVGEVRPNLLYETGAWVTTVLGIDCNQFFANGGVRLENRVRGRSTTAIG